MKKITFGIPEQFVPTRYCPNLQYKETEISFDISQISFETTAQGCTLTLPIAADEEVYGFGLQLKEFKHKGRRLRLKVNSDPVAPTGDSHAPVPFFVTTKGYGIYVDTARYLEIYCGLEKKKFRKSQENTEVKIGTDALYAQTETTEENEMVLRIPAAKGVDLYIFEGETITDIVAQYNMFSGGGCDVPTWGLGVIYRAYGRSTEKDIAALTSYFEAHDIPCDILGLEPGWQSSAYSCSYVWNPSNFPNYEKMVKDLIQKGYHINLWEHGFVNSASPVYADLYPLSGNYEVWQGLVPDFSLPEAQAIFAEHHRKALIDLGIDGFKLDECDSSDYIQSDWSFPDCAKFPSGMDGEQYHMLFGVLYMQAILKALGEKKTLSEVRSAGALCASYPFVLYSDLYDFSDYVRGIVNSGFSGILWTPEVRDAGTKREFIRRLQTNIFSVQCLINAWYCDKAPWLDLDCEEETKELLNIRKSLVPMLKKAFDKYKETGVPPVRALVSDYTSDKETYGIDDQYLFCENLLVAPIMGAEDSRKVYLPAGKWRDYWTKEEVASGWFTVHTENIPVYERID